MNNKGRHGFQIEMCLLIKSQGIFLELELHNSREQDYRRIQNIVKLWES